MPTIDGVGSREIVDQHHGSGAFAAGVVTDRGALPKHAAVAGIPCVKIAVAVAHTNYESATDLLSKDVAIGLAPPAESFFNDFRQTARYRAEEVMSRADHFVGRKGIAALRRRRRGWRRLVLGVAWSTHRPGRLPF